MTDEEKKFMEKNFKAGEYMVVSVFVKKEEFTKFIETLKSSNLNLAVLPNAKANSDMFDDNAGKNA